MLALLTLGVRQCLVVQTVLCIPGCSAVSLASTHQIIVFPPPPPRADNQNVCGHCVTPGAEFCRLESHYVPSKPAPLPIFLISLSDCITHSAPRCRLILRTAHPTSNCPTGHLVLQTLLNLSSVWLSVYLSVHPSIQLPSIQPFIHSSIFLLVQSLNTNIWVSSMAPPNYSSFLQADLAAGHHLLLPGWCFWQNKSIHTSLLF